MEEIKRIRTLFEAIDSDKDGLLEKSEIVHAHGGDADGLLKGDSWHYTML